MYQQVYDLVTSLPSSMVGIPGPPFFPSRDGVESSSLLPGDVLTQVRRLLPSRLSLLVLGPPVSLTTPMSGRPRPYWVDRPVTLRVYGDHGDCPVSLQPRSPGRPSTSDLDHQTTTRSLRLPLPFYRSFGEEGRTVEDREVVV